MNPKYAVELFIGSYHWGADVLRTVLWSSGIVGRVEQYSSLRGAIGVNPDRGKGTAARGISPLQSARA